MHTIHVSGARIAWPLFWFLPFCGAIIHVILFCAFFMRWLYCEEDLHITITTEFHSLIGRFVTDLDVPSLNESGGELRFVKLVGHIYNKYLYITYKHSNKPKVRLHLIWTCDFNLFSCFKLENIYNNRELETFAIIQPDLFFTYDFLRLKHTL